MKATKITDKVYWVGAIDWAIKEFHGYATDRGTTYNAYLVLGDKITLVDTVKAPFKTEMLARIKSVIGDPSKIDYIISNHSEPDHSGSLADVIKEVRPEKVYASQMGVKTLNAHFKFDMEITAVKSGESIDLGNLNFTFLETRMLHWPDSMFSYIKEEKILFSQDGFGMHLATSKLFADEIDPAIIYWEGAKYYANILLPYSQQVLKLIEALPGFNLDISIVAPDHGPVWRKDPLYMATLYKKWAEQKPQPKAVIVYDTMWQSTAAMARSVADGIKETGVEVTVISLSSRERSHLATELLEAGMLIVGSPTINNNIYPSLADVLTYIRGLKPQNLIGASFGSYGWSGESIQQANEYLKQMNVELFSEGVKAKYVPKEEDLNNCFELGKKGGELLKEKVAASK